MDTSEKIVEAYVRHVKKCATIPNLKCDGQAEIDLLAINPLTGERYHIETSVVTASAFSLLTDKPFDDEVRKQRTKQASQRRTVGFFVVKKFGPAGVSTKLAEYGFKPGSYRKVIVTMGATPEALARAKREGIEVWHFPEMLTELQGLVESDSSHIADDTLRTLQLLARGLRTKHS